ncbi:hypothetical protein EfmAA242_32780 (plasmid) [Enterococcus faecium]|nr:hypothetical protein EfmAA242_32780 [Enterococcus faecium]
MIKLEIRINVIDLELVYDTQFKQTENPKRVPSFRVFLYNPRMASMPLIVVEAVRKLREVSSIYD